MRAAVIILGSFCAMAAGDGEEGVMYVYTLTTSGTAGAYDEAMAAACIQGIVNRDGPRVYVVSAGNVRPQYWLDTLSQAPGWLAGKKRVPVADLDALVALAGKRLKGAVVWDPAVPATVNVATTIAGVKDGVVLSPDMAERSLPRWNLPVLEDLRGRFDGAGCGSKKNDAYRWAVREYLAKGLCSPHLLCLFEDSCQTRDSGGVGYVVTRDWAVTHRAFVFDLSPWGDEKPKDDPGQAVGTDLETYRMILDETLRQSAGQQMTELTGFFSFWKYSNMPGYASGHEPVPTEWETVYLISPYNVYQNTISSDCYNESFHAHAPVSQIKQHGPQPGAALEPKAYVCILMADYDSATPLYDFLPKYWADPGRGKIPLAWGINPNLLETYPDVIEYFYRTATPNDFFTSDASAAGYMNPNRVRPEYLPLFVKHNKGFFDRADMTIAPMVLDWDQPTEGVKDAFTQFAPDGYATIVMDLHGAGGKTPQPHMWKGMPVTELINDTCNFANPKQTSDAMYGAIRKRGDERPGFYFFRIVWTPPSLIIESLDTLRKDHPKIDFEVVDPYTFFDLFKRHYAKASGMNQ
ncbi:MAG: GxGYxYP family putative glycoside hydrolase [Candidatus Hydrogenedentes bacterium]|nr:GxGYxYP family putative glycoside hydrolase [Candidatus Hydrogenedentota bacterium]